MKGAQPQKIGTGLFKLNVASDHLHHIRSSDELLQKALWNRHQRLATRTGLEADLATVLPRGLAATRVPPLDLATARAGT